MRFLSSILLLALFLPPAHAGCVEDLMSLPKRKLPSEIAREEGVNFLAIQVSFETLVTSLTKSKKKSLERFYVTNAKSFAMYSHDVNHLLPIASKRISPIQLEATNSPLFIFKTEVLNLGDWWIANKDSLLTKKPFADIQTDSLSSEDALRAYFKYEAKMQRTSFGDSNESALVLGYVIPIKMVTAIVLPTRLKFAQIYFAQHLVALGFKDLAIVISDDYRGD